MYLGFMLVFAGVAVCVLILYRKSWLRAGAVVFCTGVVINFLGGLRVDKRAAVEAIRSSGGEFTPAIASALDILVDILVSRVPVVVVAVAVLAALALGRPVRETKTPQPIE